MAKSKVTSNGNDGGLAIDIGIPARDRQRIADGLSRLLADTYGLYLKTYTQLARREPVLQGAIESLGLNMSWQELAGRVSSNIVAQTLLMEISVVDSHPYRAKVLADSIANELILQSPSAGMATNQKRWFSSSLKWQT